MTRPDWDSVWLDVARALAARSLCARAQVCAVVTDPHNRLVSSGYNGPPAEFQHFGRPCSHWCNRGSMIDLRDPPSSICLSVHAEANALLTGDRSRREGGTMYVTKHPCWECAKLIANSGVVRLVVAPVDPTPVDHHSHDTYDFMERCGVTVEVVE